MVQAVVKGVAAVASAVADAQRVDFDEFDFQYQSGSRWLAHAFDSCKRHIMSSNGIEEESRKRRKAGSISTYTSAIPVDKENNHPNVDENDFSGEKQLCAEIDVTKIEKSSHKHDLEVVDVMALKVVDLREILGERGLDTTGLKKVLQNRLVEAIQQEKNNNIKNHTDTMEIVAERDEIESEATPENMSETKEDSDEIKKSEKEKIEKKDSEEVEEDNVRAPDDEDISMRESDDSKSSHRKRSGEEMTTEEDVEMVEEKTHSCAEVHDEPVQHPDAIKVEPNKKASYKKTFGAKILSPIKKVFSPNKTKKSPIKSKGTVSSTNEASVMNEGEKSMGQNNNSSCDEQIVCHKLQSKPKRESMVCNMTVDEIKSAKKNKDITITSNERPENKHTSSQKTNNSVTSSSQKLRSMKEARKARLDEIRNKVQSKTLSQLNTSKKQIVNASSTKVQQTKGVDAANRKRELANQMRQKAMEAAKHQANTEVNCMEAPTRSVSPQEQTQYQHNTTKKEEKKPLSPMETYEMSDRGESDSDESDYDNRGPKKKIPKWAQRENLRPALERQFLDGPYKLDPDEIFPEVSTCDLEAIFDQKKKRYLKRTSSGNWTKDKVTISEKLVYKRNMGFRS